MTETNNIRMFLHCRRCMTERPSNISPQDYAKIEVGLTHSGMVQVWCLRHDMNVGIVTPEMMAAHMKCQCEGCVEEKR